MLLRRRRVLSGSRTMLSQAEAYWKASRYSGSGDLADLSNNSHPMVMGTGSNAPQYLAYTGTRYAYLPGTAGNYASTPDANVLDITGDIDVRVAVAMDDWTPAANMTLLGKWTSTGNQRSYRLTLTTGGTFTFNWSTLGSDTVTFTSSVAPTVSDGALLLVRATLDVDNGAAGKDCVFYTKTSTEATAYADMLLNTGWTQLGTTQTALTTTSIFSGTGILEVGTRDVGTTEPSAGKFYGAAVLSGIAGTAQFAANFTDATVVKEPYATFAEKSSNAATVTVNRPTTAVRKAIVVDQPCFLFGSDDYMEAADSDRLDFGVDESLTLIALTRVYTNGAQRLTLIGKKSVNNNTTAGYALYVLASAVTAKILCADGTTSTNVTAQALTAGTAGYVAGVRDTSKRTNSVIVDGVASADASDALAATLANALTLRIGADSGAVTSPLTGEIFAAALWRKALTPAQIAKAVAELRVQ